jgi:hypothetical protein
VAATVTPVAFVNPAFFVLVSLLVVQPPSAHPLQGIDRWTLRQELVVGSRDEPASSFGLIADVTVGNDDRLYVLDRQARTVCVFGGDGTPVLRVGAHGRGPGEFETPASLGFLADTLWVTDMALGRVTFFDRGGTVLGTLRLQYLPEDPRLFPMVPRSLLMEGMAIAGPGVSPTIARGNREIQLPVVRMDRSGSVLDTLFLRAYHKTAILTATAGTLGYQPLADDPLWRARPDGSAFVLVDRSAPTRPDAGRFRVRSFEPDGRLLFDRDYGYVPRRVDPALVDSLLGVARRMIPIPRSADATVEQQLRDGLYVSEYEPGVRALVTGRDGTIWLRVDALRDPRPVWRVLSSDGEPVAEVLLPRHGLELVQADRDHVWAIERDELDVQYVVRFRVLR